MLKPLALSIALLAIFAAGQTTVKADSIVPGQSIGPVVTPLPAGTQGVLLATTGVQTLPSNTGSFTSSLTASVFRNSAGTLDFYYTVSNSAASRDALGRITASNFGTFTTDIFVSGAAGQQNAALINRSVDGNVLRFDFQTNDPNTLIQPGETTFTFIVRTNATNFTSGFASVIDGGTANFAAYQPTAVPEPATMLLLGTGLAGVAARIRKRRKAAQK